MGAHARRYRDRLRGTYPAGRGFPLRLPAYHLRQREAIFPERGFPSSLARLYRDQPPGEGWQAARAAFLELFRSVHASGRSHLGQRYVAGASGHEIVRGHAFLTDRLIQSLWRVLGDYLESHRRELPLCVVAVGGYGRAELHPFSDIDLLLLHEGSPEEAAAFAEPLLHFLWDIGLPVSHALRTPTDCISDARHDLSIQTSLLEARPLAGDPELFDRFETAFQPEAVTDFAAFLAAKEREQAARHDRYGGPVYHLEPNVKESWGGLRDIHQLYWLARFRYGSASLRQVVTAGALTATELRRLRRAREFLWRIRNGLHYMANRNENRLLFEHQHDLARELGYTDSPNRLAVEKLMQRYYRALRQVATLTGIGVQALKEREVATVSWGAGAGLVLHDGFLEASDPNSLRRDPAVAVPLFQSLQRNNRDEALGAATRRALWEGARSITAQIREDSRVRAGLLDLLRLPGHVARVLHPLNAYGLLGRLIPEFGRIVGQSQHNLYHIYPVDEHTLRAVAVADRFFTSGAKQEGASELACRVAPGIRRPEVLYLALLGHDIAKGQGGDHSVLGARVTHRIGRRLGLDPEDAGMAAWLVRSHLFLSHTSQKRDIHDPETITEVAARIRNLERLDLLLLLTEADMRATGPQVWNAWKAQLLGDLYLNIRQALRTGVPADARARARRIRQRILTSLIQKGFSDEAVRGYLRRLGQDYLLHYHPEELINHTHILLSETGPTIVSVAPHPRAAGTEILVYTPDQPGLFTRASGYLAGLGLNIVEAKIHTTRDQWALDTFLVLDGEGQPVADAQDRGHIRNRLFDALTHPAEGVPQASGRDLRWRGLRHFPTPVAVAFPDSGKSDRTLLEVTAPDAPGILHRIARVLSEHQCEVHAAKVATFGERTEDTFQITRRSEPITDPDMRQALADAIHSALEGNATH